MDGTSTCFLERVLEGELRTVREMLAATPALAAMKTDESFEHAVPPGSTPLHLAVRQGHAEIIDALIAAGAPLDAAEPRRPHAAARCAAVRQPHAGAPHRARARRSTSATLRSSIWSSAVRDLLLGDPALANDRTTGLSPLGWACYGGAARAARLLIELGARADDGELLCAAQVGGVQVRAGCCSIAAPIPIRLHRGFNALHAALTTPYTDDLASFVALVIEHGADVNASTGSGRRPLDLLAQARTLPGSSSARRRSMPARRCCGSTAASACATWRGYDA